MPRPRPQADHVSVGFWGPGDALRVQRCSACRTYYQPPVAVCSHCLSPELSFEEVSGRGRVFSFTEVASGARHPAFTERCPYLLGLVELIEQELLLLYTNFPGASLGDLSIGAEVMVEFEEIAEGVLIPQFRLVDASRAS